MARKGAMKMELSLCLRYSKTSSLQATQKIPFPKTVICYLLFVTQKIHLWKLSTVNCNAWCELALSKKTGTVLAKPIFPFRKL